ncbi:MAG: four-carbon acid sugar kinase family protein, partial [Deltaproteobacteria bacterium]|nr:four-carbon acid sugar kinase family protein [Deltaproteobacteria bacterium]
MATAIIIADDFTGAGDSGVHFARAGKRTALLLDHAGLESELSRYEMLSLSSESRFLGPGRAAAAVRALVARCAGLGAEIIFKKVDSTLRGNLGAEIEAILKATGRRAALVC